MNRVARLLVLALLYGFATVVPAAAQWEASGFIGAAHTQNSDLHLRLPAFSTDLRFAGVSYRGESFQSPLYYGARFGRFFHRHFGGEVEFIHLKVFADVDQPATISGTVNGVAINARQPIDTVVQRFSISHGVNLLMANFVARRELGGDSRHDAGRLALTLRIGAGTTIPHAEATVLGQADEHYQVGSPVFQVAGGTEVRVWRKLWWVGEYKYTRVRETVDVLSGAATTLLQSHHVVTGPAMHF